MFSQMLAMVGGDNDKNGSKDQKPAASKSSGSPPLTSNTAPARTAATSSLTRPAIKSSLSAKEQEEQRKRIERLKAARLGSQPASKVEKKAPQTLQKKKTAPPASSSTPRKVPAPVTTSTKPPARKLNFREIMKQAEKVDSEKLKVTVRVKDGKDKSAPAAKLSTSKAPEPRGRVGSKQMDDKPISRRPSSGPISSMSRISSAGPISSASRQKNGVPAKQPKSASPPQASAQRQSSAQSSRNCPASKDKEREGERERPAPVARTPAPLAQPMQKLVDKRKQKAEVVRRGYYDEDDESLDDFIVDDEEEEEVEEYNRGRAGRRRDEDQGYDRDEIWQMFNRGKRRSDFINVDDDLSDMEATGAELFHEEQRSLRVAREEDEAEERELKRLAREKQLRKQRRQ